MIKISPVKKAFVPKGAKEAQKISSPNYDEFQSDLEIYESIRNQPASILKVTMPHCDVGSEDEIEAENSKKSLSTSHKNFENLIKGGLVKSEKDVLFIYDIEEQGRQDVRQIGLGCMAKTSDIRTAKNPVGSIIRNEGIKEKKAQGRAEITRNIGAFVESVNIAVEDREDLILACLIKYSETRPCDYFSYDEMHNKHKVWVVREPQEIAKFVQLFEKEPLAFVADGNHRSAAAALLNYDTFLTVFFPLKTMQICPYNRLVKNITMSEEQLISELKKDFIVEKNENQTDFKPEKLHVLGLYINHKWCKLMPKDGLFNPHNAVEDIDADIVQKHILGKILGIQKDTDERITFVGGNRDNAYLTSKVDNGEYNLSFVLPPVTLQQFVNVCMQNSLMPPKSTWFSPKIRAGLMLALTEDR